MGNPEKNMKLVWIGVIGTLFGAVLGALVTIIGQTHYEEWVHGPNEAKVDVDVTSIGSRNVNEALRSQIDTYPIFLKVVHSNGPTAKGITVRIESKNPLSGFEQVRQDDPASISLSEDKKTLTLEIPELRRSAVVEYHITSQGDPEYTKNVLISEGVLKEEATTKVSKKSWYESEGFFLTVFLIIVVGGVLLIIYESNRVVGGSITEPLKDKDFFFIFVLTFAFSVLPLFGSLAVLLPLLIIWKLLKKTSHLEQCLRNKNLYEEQENP